LVYTVLTLLANVCQAEIKVYYGIIVLHSFLEQSTSSLRGREKVREGGKVTKGERGREREREGRERRKGEREREMGGGGGRENTVCKVNMYIEPKIKELLNQNFSSTRETYLLQFVAGDTDR
jgi:hypothetical protein